MPSRSTLLSLDDKTKEVAVMGTSEMCRVFVGPGCIRSHP